MYGSVFLASRIWSATIDSSTSVWFMTRTLSSRTAVGYGRACSCAACRGLVSQWQARSCHPLCGALRLEWHPKCVASGVADLIDQIGTPQCACARSSRVHPPGVHRLVVSGEQDLRHSPDPSRSADACSAGNRAGARGRPSSSVRTAKESSAAESSCPSTPGMQSHDGICQRHRRNLASGEDIVPDRKLH